MKSNPLHLGIIVLFLSASHSPAQVQQWDFTDRASQFENKRFEVTVTEPEAGSRWMSRRFNTQRFPTQQHRFAQQRFDSGKVELFRTRDFETRELDFEVREVEWFRGKDQQFSDAELLTLKNNTLHQFDRQESFAVQVDRAVDIEEVLDQLSLADLNRFQFRRSRSDDSEIPTQQAGGEETTTSS